LVNELSAAADRARDERIRLAQALKQKQGQVADQGGIASADQVARLGEKITQLDKIVQARLDTLAQSSDTLDVRTAKLEDLQNAVDQTTQAFTKQVESAQHFKHHVDAAKKHVRMSSGQIIDDVKEHLAQFEGPIADRLVQLNDLDDAIDQRIARMQQMHKQAAEAVDKHLLAALRGAKEQAAELAAPIKEELDLYLKAQSQTIEQGIRSKIAELDVDVEDALSPLAAQFEKIVKRATDRADELAETLPAKLDAQIDHQLGPLRERIAKRVDQVVSGIDPKVLAKAEQRYRDQVNRFFTKTMADHEAQADKLAEDLDTRLDDALAKANTRYDTEADQMRSTLSTLASKTMHAASRQAQALETRLEGAAEQATARVDEVIETLETQHARKADSLVEQLRTQLEALSQQSQDQARSALDRVTDAVTLTAARSHALADEELTKIESQTANRVAGLADLAQASGQRVSEALEAMGQAASATAAQTQQQLDEQIDAMKARADQAVEPLTQMLAKKMSAFDQVAGQAMEEAEETLRKNLAELRSSAQAMAGSINTQLYRQIEGIAPEADAALKQAEHKLRQRIAELREGAQGMIESTSRQLENQLKELRASARRRGPIAADLNDAAIQYDTPEESVVMPIIDESQVAGSLDALSQRLARGERQASQDAA